MKYIEIKAPAKINIGLNIVEKRDDGFHNLETFFYPIHDLYDKLIFELAESFSFRCNEKSVNNDEDNLVLKSVRLLEEFTGKKFLVKIELQKKIPIGAGLGGGSSDSAATLISLNELFGLKISYETLVNLALQLGSDVPFFLKAKPAIGKSRGDVLTIKEIDLPYQIVIINPGIHISTKEAFQNITPKKAKINYDDVFQSLDSFLNNKERIVNDFEEFVFTKHPEIQFIKESLIKYGSEFSLMSGSGSTVYGLFKDKIELDRLSAIFPKEYFIFISSSNN